MKVTKLSSRGQVIIPKSLRAAHHWESGLELLVIDTGDGILLKPRTPFAKTSLDTVAGSLQTDRPMKSDREIRDAVRKGVRRQWCN